MADKRDYYEVLGVSKTASDDELKKAYRSAAKKYHPDLHPGDKAAEAKFKEANEAYEILSDPQKKAAYDRFGFAGVDPNAAAQGGAGNPFGGFDVDLGDIFGDIFGGFGGFGGRTRDPNAPQRGTDATTTVTISFEDAAKGCDKEIDFFRIEQCDMCHGSGAAEGSKRHTCPDCNGSGRVSTTRRTILGTVQSQSVCGRCGGKGTIIDEPCRKCHGRGMVETRAKLKISIPAGIDNGQIINARGEGNRGINGGGSGDLKIAVNVRPHPIFERDGYNVWCEMHISFAAAAIGCELEVPTIDGKVRYDVPGGTQSGDVFKLKNRGIRYLNGRGTGDELVRIIVDVPKKLTEEQKTLLKQLDASFGNPVNYIKENDTGFFKKKRKR